ncbi:type II toxin-antitoxin system VapC family toxin [Candidatus Bipolaricaulota bacterium]|nr:type II toxin-antitoxin system VapC family toxin [Candidatus Bipolaricaulota bacterium]
MTRKARVLIDTDVFVIDLRYHRDPKYSENRAFLERVRQGEFVGRITVYNLMEVCGILSFNLSPQSLEELFMGLATRYNVAIFFPPDEEERTCFDPVEILETMKQKFSFGDALIAELAQRHRKWLDLFVTWNVVHFADKLPLRVVTPGQIGEM